LFRVDSIHLRHYRSSILLSFSLLSHPPATLPFASLPRLPDDISLPDFPATIPVLIFICRFTLSLYEQPTALHCSTFAMLLICSVLFAHILDILFIAI